MKKVLALVGESGSGKSAIAERLRYERYNVIDSYTTREPRFEGEKGHFFTDVKKYVDDFQQNRVVADILYDNNFYWTTTDQFEEGWNVYVVEPVGLRCLYKNKKLETLGIYIKVDEETRRNRMRKDRSWDAAETRIEHDREAFKLIQCAYVIDNNGSLDETVQTIKKIMEG